MKPWQANILMMLTALIWGLAFVAQRLGMESVGPYTYNGVRFALGALSLLPLILVTGRSARKKNLPEAVRRPGLFAKITVLSGLLAGLALFTGASLQQVGLQYTTAGKAGFITGLYVVLVPLIGLFWRQRPDGFTWMGAFMAAAGLWFLCVNEAFRIEYGDVLELIGAFFWAGHVLLIGWLSPKLSTLRLAFWQFATCSALSLLTAVAIEIITLDGILAAAVPILYGGLGSVGVAYTLQVVAQKYTRPAHAAIILSMESPFAALGGWIVLNEVMGMRSLTGCALMLGGMMLSQIGPFMRPPRFLKKLQRSAA